MQILQTLCHKNSYHSSQLAYVTRIPALLHCSCLLLFLQLFSHCWVRTLWKQLHCPIFQSCLFSSYYSQQPCLLIILPQLACYLLFLPYIFPYVLFNRGEFEITCVFYVRGSNSLMNVCVSTLNFGKLLYICKYQRKYFMS